LQNGNIPARDLAELLIFLPAPGLASLWTPLIPWRFRKARSTLSQLSLKYAFSLHVKDFAVSRAWHRMGFLVEGRPAGKGQ